MSEDRLDEIKAALKTITETPWTRPISSDPPEIDGGACDKMVFGMDSVSAPFEGGGYCVVANAWSRADADFIASAPSLIQWAVEEIERLKQPPKPVHTIDYIAATVRKGATLDVSVDGTVKPATHVTFSHERIVLLDGVCPCPCHGPRGFGIMHDQACCEPIHYGKVKP
jgi:hypothetical protein